MSEEETARTMKRYARCVTSMQRDWVARALESMPMSREEANAMAEAPQQRTHGCLSEALPASFSGYSFLRSRVYAVRAAFAEALVERDFPEGRAVPGRKLAELPDLGTASRQPGLARDVVAALLLGSFGTCGAAREPETALALLRTEPVAASENGVLQRLSTAFAACFDAGRSFRINRAMLRGFLAEGLYRHLASSAAPANTQAPQNPARNP